jgi:hypothetical protein
MTDGPISDAPAPDAATIRRVEEVAASTLAGARESSAQRELSMALDQLRADRTNGEPLAESFARLCEAVAAVRNDATQ